MIIAHDRVSNNPPPTPADPVAADIRAIGDRLAARHGDPDLAELCEHIVAQHDRIMFGEAERHHLRAEIDELRVRVRQLEDADRLRAALRGLREVPA